MSRCAFCNNALLGFGEVEEAGKTYHSKCAPSARGVNMEAERAAAAEKLRQEDEKRKAEFASKAPTTIGAIEVGERKGMVVNHITGEKRYVGK